MCSLYEFNGDFVVFQSRMSPPLRWRREATKAPAEGAAPAEGPRTAPAEEEPRGGREAVGGAAPSAQGGQGGQGAGELPREAAPAPAPAREPVGGLPEPAANPLPATVAAGTLAGSTVAGGLAAIGSKGEAPDVTTSKHKTLSLIVIML